MAALLEHVSASGPPVEGSEPAVGRAVLDRCPARGHGCLHSAAVEENLGTAALVAWLRRRIAEAGDDRNDEERSLRLESDAEAVQVLTIHRSKGLEFPIVYCPYLWDGCWRGRCKFPSSTTPTTKTRSPSTWEGAPSGSAAACSSSTKSSEARDLRLLYVALTRARHQAVIWWAGSTDSGKSPLGRLLFCRDADGVVSSKGGKTPSDEQVGAGFRRACQDLSEMHRRRECGPTRRRHPGARSRAAPEPRGGGVRPLVRRRAGGGPRTRASPRTRTIRGSEASRTSSSSRTSQRLSTEGRCRPRRRHDDVARRDASSQKRATLGRSSFRCLRCRAEWRSVLSSTVCSRQTDFAAADIEEEMLGAVDAAIGASLGRSR